MFGCLSVSGLWVSGRCCWGLYVFAVSLYLGVIDCDGCWGVFVALLLDVLVVAIAMIC